MLHLGIDPYKKMYESMEKETPRENTKKNVSDKEPF